MSDDYNAEFDSLVKPAAAPAQPASFDDEFNALKQKGITARPVVPQTRSTTADVAAEGGKGLGRGLADFAGDLGEAVMGPFGPSQHLGHLLHDIGLGPKPEDEPSYGQQLSHAAGIEAAPQTTPGKYAGSIGEMLGNPATYAGPGGLLAKTVMGAASGAGAEAAGEAAEGSGWEGPARTAGALAAGPLAARALKPQLAPAQQMLADRGVTQMTPGQMTGGLLKDAEDKLSSVPILGHFIQNARGRSIESFNRSVANQALEPIGEQVGRRTAAGHDTVAEVERRLSDAYDRVIPNIHFVPDYDFAHDLATIRQEAGMLPASNARQFDAIINDRLTPARWIHQINMPPAAAPGSNTLGQQATHLWGLQGPQFKSIESELTHLAGRYGSSADAGQQLLGERLGDVVTAMRQSLERTNPTQRAELQRVNAGWAMYSRIRAAAANRRGSEGVFTPGDLLTAVKRGDRSVAKGSFARGNALMQDFAEAGQRVLPSKVPDSGTAGRGLMSLAASGGLGFVSPKIMAGVAAATVPYLRPSIYMLNRYAAPTGGVRAAYSNAGRGVGTLRPLMQTSPYGAGPGSPYGQ